MSIEWLQLSMVGTCQFPKDENGSWVHGATHPLRTSTRSKGAGCAQDRWDVPPPPHSPAPTSERERQVAFLQNSGTAGSLAPYLICTKAHQQPQPHLMLEGKEPGDGAHAKPFLSPPTSSLLRFIQVDIIIKYHSLLIKYKHNLHITENHLYQIIF